MKKIFSLLLAVMLLVSGMSLAAFADTSASYSVTVSDSTAEIGDTVTISVALNECADVWNVYFELALPSGLKYVSSSVNSNFAEETGMKELGFNESAMVCSAFGALDAGYTGGAVNMLTVTCEVVEAGELTVSLNNAAVYDENGYSVKAGVSSASVSVAAPHEHDCSDEWTYDEDGHWHKCSTCDVKVDYDKHTLGEWVENEAGTERTRGCSCGYTVTESVEPVVTEKPADPEVTKKPAEPETTKKPVDPETTKKPVDSSKSPQTGDFTAFVLVAVICAAAVVVIVSSKKSKAQK